MQKKSAEQLIQNTRHLVGDICELQVLDRNTNRYDTRRYRIVSNDHIINLKPPDAGRVCLDVYARLEDTETGEMSYISLDKFKKQRM